MVKVDYTKYKQLIFFSILTFLFSFCLQSNNTNAASLITCLGESETEEYNAATKYACNECHINNGMGPYGTTWINNDFEHDPNLDYQNTFVEANRTEDGDETIAYLHGQFYTCKQTYSTELNSLDAHMIHFIEPETTGYEKYSVGKYSNEVSYITNISEGKLIRGTNNSSLGQYEWSTPGNGLKILINTDKFASYARNHSDFCDFWPKSHRATCSVGIWRCPTTTNTIDNSCWANNTTISVQDIHSRIAGKSTATDHNNANNTASTDWVYRLTKVTNSVSIDTIKVKKGDTALIDFSHNMLGRFEYPEQVDWKVYTFLDGTLLTKVPEGTFEYPGCGNNIDANGNDTDPRCNRKSENSIGGYETEVYKETFEYDTADAKIGDELKICQRLVWTNPRSNKDLFSEACATVQVVTPDAPEYLTASRVSSGISGGNLSKKTGIRKDTTKITDEISVDPNTDIVIEFSHNIFSNKKTTGATWSISQDFSANNGSYTLSHTTNNKNSGLANIVEPYSDTKYFTADIRPYSKYGAKYIAYNAYTVNFQKAGKYNFCETVSANGNSITTACKIITVGSPEPEPEVITDCSNIVSALDPMHGKVQVSSQVENSTIETGLQKQIYAKPGDLIVFHDCYFPGVQSVANTEVTLDTPLSHPNTSMGEKIQDAETYAAELQKTANNMLDFSSEQLKRTQFKDYFTLNNSFTSSYENSAPHTYAIGDTTLQTLTLPHTVLRNEVGQNITETITSGAPTEITISPTTDSWRCVNSGTYLETTTGKNGNTITNEVIGDAADCEHNIDQYTINNPGNASDSSAAIIPYNYINSVTININNSTIYTGETASLSANAINGKRANSTTGGNYATVSPQTRIKIFSYTAGAYDTSASYIAGNVAGLCANRSNCQEYDPGFNLSLNNDNNTNGATINNAASVTHTVADIQAGNYFCAIAAIYPSNSGSETSLAKTGSNDWYISTPTCKQITKKPSFQVWGGSVYSNGAVVASYSPKFFGTYGSWIEQGLLTNGGSVGVTTGTALGYTTNNNGTLLRPTYTIQKTDYCSQIPLTFPNADCANGSNKGKQLGNYNGLVSFKNSILTNIVTGKKYQEVAGTNIDISSTDNYALNNKERLTKITSENTTIFASQNLPLAQKHIIISDGNITINSDLRYEDTYYTNTNQIPEYIIYAKNININCKVSHIDAWLIAENTIDSCADGGDANDPARSRQLTIDGVIVAAKLNLTRTYGAGTGASSIIPAEIIDLSPFAQLYSKSQSTTKPTLYTTYRHELAPRF